MPLDTCGAMSQGMIGYWMENAIEKALKKRNINKDVATVITRVVVDKKMRHLKIQLNQLVLLYRRRGQKING